MVKLEIPHVGYALVQYSEVRQKLRRKMAQFLREKRGDLTLAQFARKLGISDSTLQRLEIGEQNITIDTLEEITDRLKCNLADIFGKN